MSQLKARRFWRIRWRYAMWVLVCLGLCGLAPAALAQTSTTSEGGQTTVLVPNSDGQPIPFLVAPKSKNEKKSDEFAVRAGAKLAKGDFDGAIPDYTKALKLNPRNLIAFNPR